MDEAGIYEALRAARHETVRVRGLDIHLTRWGPVPAAAEPPVLLLHGWLDSGLTFQFVVDAFARERPLLALDWRGFGRSEWPQQGYFFPDYLGDLDALLGQLAPSAPVCLVGHSMGGNVASLYAGLRPERVRCVVSLEGFGSPRTSSGEAAARMRQWLEQLQTPINERGYHSFEQLAAVIQFRYPRFPPGAAAFVARAWGTASAQGGVRLAADPRHRWVNPTLYQRADAEAVWREIRAPMLMLCGAESDYLKRLGGDGSTDALRAAFPGAEVATVAQAGHMLHIERPAAVAAVIEKFLDAN